MKLSGKVALVTGGSRGIGRAIALGFAREGADVVINYASHAEAAEKVVKQIKAMGRNSLAIKANVAEVSQIDKMVGKIYETFGKIDILMNNAGICILKPFLETTEEEWDKTIDINLKGIFFCAQTVAKKMIAQEKPGHGVNGRIINMTSINSIVAEANQAVYNASKAGINLITKSLAIELAGYNIRVNALGPGFILTEAAEEDIADPKVREEYLKNIPLGRFGVPEDVVGAAVFLASDDSDYFQGQTLYMDGGIIVQQMRPLGKKN